MKIRILHVIDHLGFGGAPFVVKNLVERMPADRIESIVCALRPNPRPLPINAPVITLKLRKYGPGAARSLAKLCRQHRIDIVHAHLQKAVLSSLWAKRRCGAKLVIHEHGPIFREGGGDIYRRLLKWLGPRADAIIANSEAVKSGIEQVLPAGHAQIAVVANFIDLKRFDPERYDRSAVRQSLGLGENRFVVGFVGRLDPAKGADLLVEAAAILRNDKEAYCLFLIGDGPQRQALEERIRRLGLEGTVILAGLHEDPAALMRAFDVGVVPSRREAFGIAALELMRMRVPVIVAPVGGLPELVLDGDVGMLLPRLTPDAIAHAIRTLAWDSILRETLSRKAFEHASSFDGRRPIEQIVEIYERLTISHEHRDETQESAGGS
jgi:glycosyltransferase involved in cell wall biosynthesis